MARGRAQPQARAVWLVDALVPYLHLTLLTSARLRLIRFLLIQVAWSRARRLQLLYRSKSIFPRSVSFRSLSYRPIFGLRCIFFTLSFKIPRSAVIQLVMAERGRNFEVGGINLGDLFLHGPIDRNILSAHGPLPVLSGVISASLCTTGRGQKSWSDGPDSAPDSDSRLEIGECCGSGAVWKAFRLVSNQPPSMVMKLCAPVTFSNIGQASNESGSYDRDDAELAIKRDFDVMNRLLGLGLAGSVVPDFYGTFAGKAMGGTVVWGMLMGDAGDTVAVNRLGLSQK